MFSVAYMKNLTKDNLQTSFDGKLWIMTKRQKTGVESNIMLLDIPKQIIEKYDGMAKEDYLLPVPQYITACKNIKKIIGLCGIEKEITVASQPPYYGDGNLPDQRRSHRNPFQDARTHKYPHHADLCQNHSRKGKSGHGGTLR